MSEIDAIISQIQHDASVLDERSQIQNVGAVLQTMLRLAWEVKQLQSHYHGVDHGCHSTGGPRP